MCLLSFKLFKLLCNVFLFWFLFSCFQLCFDSDYDAYSPGHKVTPAVLPSSVGFKLWQHSNHTQLASDEAVSTVSDAHLAARQQYSTVSESETLGCDTHSRQT